METTQIITDLDQFFKNMEADYHKSVEKYFETQHNENKTTYADEINKLDKLVEDGEITLSEARKRLNNFKSKHKEEIEYKIEQAKEELNQERKYDINMLNELLKNKGNTKQIKIGETTYDSVNDAAEKNNVSRMTISRWIKCGKAKEII